MYKGVINSPIEVIAGEPIPFETLINDGMYTDIKEPGKPVLIGLHDYIVASNVVITGVPRGSVASIKILSCGKDIPHAVASVTSFAASFINTLNIMELMHARQADTECACLSVVTDVDCTINAGSFCVA